VCVCVCVCVCVRGSSGGKHNAAARQTRVALDTVLDRDRRLYIPPSVVFHPFPLSVLASIQHPKIPTSSDPSSGSHGDGERRARTNPRHASANARGRAGEEGEE